MKFALHLRKSALALAIATACLFAGQAVAGTYAGECGTFTAHPAGTIFGSFTCPTAASLGLSGPLTGYSEYVVLNSGYSSGTAANVSNQTVFTVTGGTTDTVMRSGPAVSNPVSSDGVAFNNFMAGPPAIPAGFYDTVSAESDPIINFSSSFTAGSALSATGYAYVVYNYAPGAGPPGGAVVGLCVSFFTTTGTIFGSSTCPSAAGLGVTGAVTSGYVVYDSGYSSGTAANVTQQTVFTVSGGANPTDTVTTSNGAGSPAPTDTAGLPFSDFFAGTPSSVLAGFDDMVPIGTDPQVMFSNTLTEGSALAATGYAEVVYTDVPLPVVSAPEPSSMALIGAGLAAIGFTRRRNRA